MTKSDRKRLKRIEAKLDDLLDLAGAGEELYTLTEEGERLAEQDAAHDLRAVALMPSERRTPAQVEALRASFYGCCQRHADQKACECLANARRAEGGRG